MQNKMYSYRLIEYNVESLLARHHTKSQIIYLVVLIGLILTFLSLPYISIDITTQCRSIIRSEQDNNIVMAGVYGQVIEVFIKENQEVNKGDHLLTLSTIKIDDKIRFNIERIQEQKIYIQDLKILLKQKDQIPSSAIYIQEYLQFQQRLNEQNLKLAYQKKEFSRAKQLYDEGVIAKMKYEEYQFKLNVTENGLRLIKEQQNKYWELEILNYRTKNKELLAQINQLKQDKEQYIIKAPVSGIITQYINLQPGNFIAINQSIAQISSNENLIIESYISPADIGLIREGMDVKFQIDAFSYNQWGLATGKVYNISKDIILKNKQPFFKIHSCLNEEYLSLRNGYQGNLKKGMTLTARFTITERNLNQLLYDRLDNWLNPKLG